jgi:hypothetical protein
MRYTRQEMLIIRIERTQIWAPPTELRMPVDQGLLSAMSFTCVARVYRAKKDRALPYLLLRSFALSGHGNARFMLELHKTFACMYIEEYDTTITQLRLIINSE